MKTLYLLMILVLLASCNRKNNKSDAYGNFEAIEVMVSSEANGQILNLEINEGDVIDAGKFIVLTDTTALYLQKLQLISKKSAIASTVSNVNSQIEVQKQQKENPVKGTVLSKIAEKGEINAFGKPLYKIANLNELILKAYLSGDQLSQIRIGQNVKVLIDKNKKENTRLEGKISWISEEAEFTPKIIQKK